MINPQGVVVAIKARIGKSETSPTDEEIAASVAQASRDAVSGTFGEPHIAPEIAVGFTAGHSIDHIGPEADNPREVHFRLSLPIAMFPIDSGGLQHLIGVLASDAIPSSTGSRRWSDVHVVSVDLPGNLADEARSHFGSHRDSVSVVRSSFALEQSEPLLAFSLKPRVGFTSDYAEAVTKDVIAEGFHLVEFDTRNLMSASATISQASALCAIASTTAGKWRPFGRRRSKAAFAPNLSMRADIALAAATSWSETADRLAWPGVVKIDGGLDGLSALQAIRTSGNQQHRSIIVTCYPLLREVLANRLGIDGFVQLLLLSGVDVIYPGRRPRFIDDPRPIWTSAHVSYIEGANWYDSLRSKYQVMPTIAGGPHPGHLHVAYELLGPDVAYFMGGAVSLHKRGPKQGARLCRAVLEEARDRVAKAKDGGREYSSWIPRTLVKEIEESYLINGRKAVYVPPEHVFAPQLAESAPPRPFFRRSQ